MPESSGSSPGQRQGAINSATSRGARCNAFSRISGRKPCRAQTRPRKRGPSNVSGALAADTSSPRMTGRLKPGDYKRHEAKGAKLSRLLAFDAKTSICSRGSGSRASYTIGPRRPCSPSSRGQCNGRSRSPASDGDDMRAKVIAALADLVSSLLLAGAVAVVNLRGMANRSCRQIREPSPPALYRAGPGG